MCFKQPQPLPNPSQSIPIHNGNPKHTLAYTSYAESKIPKIGAYLVAGTSVFAIEKKQDKDWL